MNKHIQTVESEVLTHTSKYTWAKIVTHFTDDKATAKKLLDEAVASGAKTARIVESRGITKYKVACHFSPELGNEIPG